MKVDSVYDTALQDSTREQFHINNELLNTALFSNNRDLSTLVIIIEKIPGRHEANFLHTIDFSGRNDAG